MRSASRGVVHVTAMVVTSLLAFGVPAEQAGARSGPETGPRVTFVRTPGGGIQPQAVCDAQGVVHVVYFAGEPAHGDIYYARREPGAERFGPPVRVNSQPGSAIAMGTIRGAQLALGRGGRVHVAWNGSGLARPANPFGGTPLLYTRSIEAGTAFEPQRNLMTKTSALDGGGTIAADPEGRVYVAWHAHSEASDPGERGRSLWIARSDDDGASFAPEVAAIAEPTGACGCCGTRALVDPHGTLHVLYRAATDGVDRDIVHVSGRGEPPLRWAILDRWKVATCPMSSMALAATPRGLLAAWETEDRVRLLALDGDAVHPRAPLDLGRGKHPTIAANRRDEAVVAWAEGTSWQKGGDLAWLSVDAQGRPDGAPRRVPDGIPTWGLPTAVALPDGSFLVVH